MAKKSKAKFELDKPGRYDVKAGHARLQYRVLVGLGDFVRVSPSSVEVLDRRMRGQEDGLITFQGFGQEDVAGVLCPPA